MHIEIHPSTLWLGNISRQFVVRITALIDYCQTMHNRLQHAIELQLFHLLSQTVYFMRVFILLTFSTRVSIMQVELFIIQPCGR